MTATNDMRKFSPTTMGVRDFDQSPPNAVYAELSGMSKKSPFVIIVERVKPLPSGLDTSLLLCQENINIKAATHSPSSELHIHIISRVFQRQLHSPRSQYYIASI